MTTDPEEAAAYLAEISPDRVPYLREQGGEMRGWAVTEKWVAGLSQGYKVYWQGETLVEVVERARHDVGDDVCIWCVEVARFDDDDAWVCVDPIHDTTDG